jgi:hypothetical protein
MKVPPFMTLVLFDCQGASPSMQNTLVAYRRVARTSSPRNLLISTPNALPSQWNFGNVGRSGLSANGCRSSESRRSDAPQRGRDDRPPARDARQRGSGCSPTARRLREQAAALRALQEGCKQAATGKNRCPSPIDKLLGRSLGPGRGANLRLRDPIQAACRPLSG